MATTNGLKLKVSEALSKDVGRAVARMDPEDLKRLDVAIGDAVRAVLILGSTPAYGGILPDGQDPKRPILVTVPTAASLTSAQRATRNVPGISFSAGLQGAIETTTVQGSLIP